MVKGHKNLQMVIFTRDSTLRENPTGMDSIIGETEVILRVISKRVFEKVMECGKKGLD
jgi:hypothetical protein